VADRPNGGRPTGEGPLDDIALVEALRRGEPRARTALVERFESHVERMVTGALGLDPDLQDIIQEVFLRVLERVHQLKDPAALSSWITSLAVFTARGHIRRRRRWRWIRFAAPQDLPEVAAGGLSPESMATMRALYRVLDSLSPEERLAFTLRFMSELELTEVATACGVSLATVKRRLARAEAHIRQAAAGDPLLGGPPTTRPRRGKTEKT
jgi:RNA polymerase sigma-70 factor (ECF subfamily)